ncbi:conserved hypothetical protein [Leishmania braziliensis MHOM/BR/75/M2904]|uniref:Uncharacterized protein n=2 Tax=Leishmania braziliensis TaxID=5660 RepID=A4H5B6_LEIBR|nr:conserved hypothetical protein [Leishmania braziliensis MHOM/BR/75/M2904]CAJ2467189.1 unnamed protein product [Leishmania braziliensis]CAM37140.1 conserved hypothetical protein [Leishmania braziliensis MHOM/BR/75/M2904]
MLYSTLHARRNRMPCHVLRLTTRLLYTQALKRQQTPQHTRLHTTESRAANTISPARYSARMPQRARPSAQRRQRSSGRRIPASATEDNETGTATKRRRADSPLNGGRSSDKKRRSGSRNAVATTATSPRLDTPTTAARTSRESNAYNRETDEEESDMLQRFSNVSVRQHARETSPSHLDSTPPPSPSRTFDGHRDADPSAYISLAQRGGQTAGSLQHAPVFALPAPPSVSSQRARNFSPALLSQLLLAEAARADATAAVQQSGHNSFEGVSYGSAAPFCVPTSMQQSQLPPTTTTTVATEWPHRRRDSDATSLYESLRESPSSLPQSPPLLSMDYLTVCIGVVPLPNSGAPCGTAAPRKRNLWWPWRCTTLTVNSTPATDDVGEAASDRASHSARAYSSVAEVSWPTPLHDPTVSMHQLRPRRLYTSGQQHTAAAAVGDSSTLTTSAHLTDVARPAPAGSVVSTDPSFSTGPTMEVLGWSGVFADVPLVLPGAQLACGPDAPGLAMKVGRDAHPRRGGCDGSCQSKDLVCAGAASISVILA